MKLAVYEPTEYSRYLEGLLRQIRDVAGSTITFYEDLQFMVEDIESGGDSFDILIVVCGERPGEGINAAYQIKFHLADCQIIFIQQSDLLIPEVYRVEHVCALSKKQVPLLLIDAVQKAVKNLLEKDRRVIYVNVDHEKRYIPLRNVFYLERVQRKTKICYETNMGKKAEIETSFSVQQILSPFQKNPFVRCHKSIFVNMQKIEGLHSAYLLLTSQERIPIGRAYQTQVRAAFLKFADSNLVEY